MDQKPGMFDSLPDAISFALSAFPVIFAVTLSSAVSIGLLFFGVKWILGWM